jgi:hypothetical protein
MALNVGKGGLCGVVLRSFSKHQSTMPELPLKSGMGKLT